MITIATSLPEKIGSISSIIGSPDSFLSLLDGIPFDQIYTNVQHSFASISRGFFETASYFGGFFSFALIIVISFYLAVQEDGVGEFLKIVTPLRFENYALDLWKRARKKLVCGFKGNYCWDYWWDYCVFRSANFRYSVRVSAGAFSGSVLS